MVKLTIDNREVEVPAGTKVIEAAELLGIMIPRFCYHPALGPVGACRVCAVAFQDGPVKGIQMSCMVNAQDGMVVSTTDDEAMDFRRHVIEWLMLNHPHDCPVCDEGGHCLLQDLTVSGGHGMRRYQGSKRTHQDQYMGPLIQHEMNRCIQCYRCSRYYQEFAGSKDLGVMGIGSRVYFGRSKPGTLESPFSGNLIDICPTGVYTDKPSRYLGRRWDFERSPSICLHCSLGCNLVVSARYRRVVRHEARPNLDVNGHFICDRGRYGYPYANDDKRPRRAMVKGEPTPLPQASEAAMKALARVLQENGPRSVAAVGSVRSSLETLVALDGLCRDNQWHGPVVIHERRKAQNIKTATGSLSTDLAVSLGAVSVAEYVLIIGADPINEAPMLAMSLRQAQRQGAHVAVVDPRAIDMALDIDHLPVPPSDLSAVIRHMIRKACGTGDPPQSEFQAGAGQIDTARFGDHLEEMTSRLCNSQRAVIICGTDITTAEEISLVAELAQTLRHAGTEAKLFYPLNGPNGFAVGRMIKDGDGIEALVDQIETGRVKALVIVENDLWHNYPDRRRLIDALSRLECLVLLDYVTSPLEEQADFFLPTQTLYEAGGLWINQEGRVQSVLPTLAGGASIDRVGKGDHPPRIFGTDIPEGTPEAAWQVLTTLGGQTGPRGGQLPGDMQANAMDRAAAVMGELHEGKRVLLDQKEGVDPLANIDPVSVAGTVASDAVSLLLVDWTLGTEGLSLNASALAEMTPPPIATLHPHTADRLGLVAGGRVHLTTDRGELTLPWQPDGRMAQGVVVIPRHHLLDWQVLGATRLELESKQIRP